MNFSKRFTSIIRSATLKALMLRGPMLAVSAMVAATPGAAFGGEPTAAELFVAKVMMVQQGEAQLHEAPASAADQMADESAQDRFVEQVLRGHLPQGVPVSPVTRTSLRDQPSWPDVSYMRGTVSQLDLLGQSRKGHWLGD